MIKVDRAGSLRMLESFRTKWLAIMEKHEIATIHNLDDWLAARSDNGGMG
jgi:hypothetical protein